MSAFCCIVCSSLERMEWINAVFFGGPSRSRSKEFNAFKAKSRETWMVDVILIWGTFKGLKVSSYELHVTCYLCFLWNICFHMLDPSYRILWGAAVVGLRCMSILVVHSYCNCVSAGSVCACSSNSLLKRELQLREICGVKWTDFCWPTNWFFFFLHKVGERSL